MYLFLIPLNIPDFAASIVFLIRVRLPGGAAIIFAQIWNFELKFIVDNPFNAKNQLHRHGKPFFAQKMFKRAKNSKSKIISMF